MEDNMTSIEFKTIIEMIIMIVESCETKEEILDKLKNLSIIKNKEIRLQRGADTETFLPAAPLFKSS